MRTKNRCYPCSRQRRKILLETADQYSIFQIALAHHIQDAVETLFMNMIYNGELSTLIPNQSVIQGRFSFIRPLYYMTKDQIRDIARIYGLRQGNNVCPFYQDSKRDVVRRFLDSIGKDNPDVYKNIFRGMFRIKKAFLPF